MHDKSRLVRSIFTRVLPICAWALPSVCLATTYYVDQKGDAGLSKSSSAKVFTEASALNGQDLTAGDVVLFRCGQVFTGPVKLTLRAGGGEGNVKVGSYGNCSKDPAPVIKGVKSLGKPKVLAAGLRQWSVDKPVTHVRVDGADLPMARWPAQSYKLVPKLQTVAKGMLPSALPSLLDISGRKESADLDGAQVWVRSQEWTIERRKVERSLGNRLDLDKDLQYPLRPGVGMYFTGKAWMIGDATPGWAYETQKDQLIARLPADASLVEAAVDEPLMTIEGKGSLKLENLDLTDAGADALKIHLDGSVQIHAVTVRRAVGNGISIAGAVYALIEESDVESTGRDAIFFAEVKRAVVQRNVVKNAGLWGPPQDALAAINAHRTDASTIEDNLVEDVAYIGIRFAGDARILRNIVLNACRRLSDCAAIYTWRRNAQHITPASLVSGNTVLGVSGDTSVKLGVNDWFAGIYLDEFVRGVEVSDNVVADAAQGVYLHNANANKVLRNRFFGSRDKSSVEGVDKRKFPVNEEIRNEFAANVVVDGRGALKVLQQGASPLSKTISVASAGGRTFALGWPDWSRGDWKAQLPSGCKVVDGWPLALPQGARAGSALLDCK